MNDRPIDRAADVPPVGTRLVRSRTTPGAAADPRTEADLRKAWLFCPDCDYEGPIDGGWCRTASGRRVDFTCPSCGATVVSQRIHPQPREP